MSKQISQLNPKPTPVAATDQLGIDDALSIAYRINVANLETYFNAKYISLSGATMTGALILSGDPVAPLGACTKQYADTIISGNFNTITKVINSSGLYTRSAGVVAVLFEGVGAGGGGGGITGGTVGQAAAAQPGSAGAYFRKMFTAAEIGATAVCVVGTKGIGGNPGLNSGTNGSTTSVTPSGSGSVLIANGGLGGPAMAKSASAQISASILLGGTATGGDINISGGSVGFSSTQASGTLAAPAAPGPSFWGMQTGNTILAVPATNISGLDAVGYGNGGGAAADTGNSNAGGGDGGDGLIIATEFI